jgi:hypothetical protein
VDWYRAASSKVRCVRCVFEDSQTYNRLVRDLKLQNLDARILGDHYREDSIITEPNTNHFDLCEPDHVARHLGAILEYLGGAR